MYDYLASCNQFCIFMDGRRWQGCVLHRFKAVGGLRKVVPLFSFCDNLVERYVERIWNIMSLFYTIGLFGKAKLIFYIYKRQ